MFQRIRYILELHGHVFECKSVFMRHRHDSSIDMTMTQNNNLIIFRENH